MDKFEVPADITQLSDNELADLLDGAVTTFQTLRAYRWFHRRLKRRLGTIPDRI
ncbi:hypothetical protein [Nonomuraea ceibae]|uniref:hypothetical protein n=1 Tax=Nonomuraea ceibae TaxID=1935170 RepID=UPI001C6044B4|nr:hypothetical protein [Nonomuraea ceibae]